MVLRPSMCLLNKIDIALRSIRYRCLRIGRISNGCVVSSIRWLTHTGRDMPPSGLKPGAGLMLEARGETAKRFRFSSANISVHQRSGLLLSCSASSASILAAKMKSFSLKPPMACVVNSILRFRYPVKCKSG